MDAATPADQRAAAAENAVVSRYVHRYGPVAWAHAAVPGSRTWHYWWHAHLIHVLHEAGTHRADAARPGLLRAVRRGVTLRTLGRWTTPFYDDVAWMTLALDACAPDGATVERLRRRLDAAIDPGMGALPWSVGSDLFNAPANGPAAIALARGHRRPSALGLDAWVAQTLDDPLTGLVRDGVEHGAVRPDLWTYNQGVAIGSAIALARGAREPVSAALHRDRAAALIEAVARWCGDDGLFPAAGGGDGGLFAGILARYLAEAAVDLAGDPERSRAVDTPHRSDAHRTAARTAAGLLDRNADALWENRRDGLFPADARRTARAQGDDLDLSVQLGAWITFEAVVAVERGGVTS